MSTLEKKDPSSYSNPGEAIIRTLHLSLDVNFEKHLLHGHVNLQIEKIKENTSYIVLDTSDLKISNVTDVSSGKELEFILDKPDEVFGSKLKIDLKGNNQLGLVSLRIKYETSQTASALQWLPPEQTSGGKLPYMFSQCQPIHCRSMIPCQDSPAVKFKYTAEITAPSELVVLMSALSDGAPIPIDGGKMKHKFRQDVPVPAYLVAIAVGNLQSRKLGPRCRVWSEPEHVDQAAHEFAETEAMLSAAEAICGEYVWGIYDILLMPMSFPFGGMENPCLTFVTPTLIAGDRSLACVIAHEIAHSWTGNLVTNRNFEHFWLNEGFTMFVERKISGRLHGEAQRQFEAINGLNDLREAIKVLGKDNPLTKLVVNLNGIHPDDAFSSCPYEKGSTFLYYLEQLVGGPNVFEPFLKKYLTNYKCKSIDTGDFKSYFMEYFKDNEAVKNLDWDKWLYTCGMPPIIPEYDASLVNPCTELASKWVKWDCDKDEQPPFSSEDLKSLNPLQIQEVLAQLNQSENFPLKKAKSMQKLYNLNSVNNSEIKFRWLRLCLKAKWADAVPLAIEFVTKFGRMKFVRPLFRDLADWEDSRSKALEAFETHQSRMMHVTAAMVSKDLKKILKSA